MREIKKRKEAIPVFEAREGEWGTLPEARALDVMRAQTNPVRRAILKLLGLGPMRKSELARHVHRRLGKKYSRSLVQHHLKQLERAGLVKYMEDPEPTSKVKLAYRAARVRVQVKAEPKPEEVPKIPDELIRAKLKEHKEKEGE